MKGVVLAPILAAFVVAGVTGSSSAAAAAFFIVLCLAGLVIYSESRKPR